MGLSIDILLEGTMIGAEASALVESGNQSNEIKSITDEFINSLNNEINGLITQCKNYIKCLSNKNLSNDDKTKADFSAAKNTMNSLKETVNSINKNTSIKEANEKNIIIFKLKESLRYYIDLYMTLCTKYSSLTKQEFDKKLNEMKNKTDASFSKLKDDSLSVEEFEKEFQKIGDVIGVKIDDDIHQGEKENNIQPTEEVQKAAEVVEKKIEKKEKKEKKEIEKAEQVSKKVETKFESLKNSIKKHLTDPSISNIAVSIAVVIAAYIILYGMLKSIKAPIKKIHNIITTIKAGIYVVKNNSIGRKIIVSSLLTVIVSGLIVIGIQGFNYIKNYIENKNNKK